MENSEPETELEDMPSIRIPCETEDDLIELAAILIDAGVITDNTFLLQNVSEDFLERLNIDLESIDSKNDGNLSFEEALEALRDGKRVRNGNWNGKDMYLEAQFPDEHSKMTQPYIYIRTVSGDLVPWLASQQDLFSGAWEILPEILPDKT